MDQDLTAHLVGPSWSVLGYMFVVPGAFYWWNLDTQHNPNGCRRGTAKLVDLPPAQGRYISTGLGRGWCSSVGAMDADAQCTLCTGTVEFHWSSSLYGVVSAPLLCNNRWPWRLCSCMLGSTVDTCSASLPGCVMDECHIIST